MENLMRYLVDNSDFFEDSFEKLEESDMFIIDDIPSDYEVIVSKDKVWCYYQNKQDDVPIQGWKLHVSSTKEDASQVLEDVAKILFDLKISFKHIYTKPQFIAMHSKNADRRTSGKFITIYPPDKFLELVLERLYEKLKKYNQATYILTDRRYLDSNIYFRYGAFQEMLSNGVLCLFDNSGNLIPDKREPFFSIPNFVDVPDCLKSSVNLISCDEDSNGLDNYEITESLKYTTSGGIYLAKNISDGRRVVIKEARANVGFDADDKSAITRLRQEYDVLNKLRENDAVVNVIEYFKVWENEYLVEEFVDGMTLANWLAKNYPFVISSDDDVNEYLVKLKTIIDQIEEIIEDIHSKGIGMSDLQPNNIMVDIHLVCKVIDFETAGDLYEEYTGLATKGFSGYKFDRKSNDESALLNLVKYLLLPISSVSDLDKKLAPIQENYIFYRFGREKIIEKFPKYFNNDTIKEPKVCNDLLHVKQGLIKGLKENVILTNLFSYGDLNSYLTIGGTLNYLNGAFGMIYALYRAGEDLSSYKFWIANQKERFKECDFGLLSGQLGIINILYIIGEVELADELLEFYCSKFSLQHFTNISVRSGLSGVILGLLSLVYLGVAEDNHKILSIVEDIIKKIESDFDLDYEKKDFLDGLSGYIFALLVYYKLTSKEEIYDLAVSHLDKVHGCINISEKSSVVQLVTSDGRLMPYLGNGIIGVSIVWYYMKYKLNKNYVQYFDELSNNRNLGLFYDSGLLTGAFSQVILESILGSDDLSNPRLMRLLNLYLIKNDSQLFLPGQLSMRRSCDVQSGNAGAILSIQSLLLKNPLLWLPLKIA